MCKRLTWGAYYFGRAIMHLARNAFPFAGSKSDILTQILPYFPAQVSNYWEPFCGTCCVGRAISDRVQGDLEFSDINFDVIAFWQSLKKDPDALVRKIYEIMSCLEMPRWEDLAVDFNKEGVFSRLDSAAHVLGTWYKGNKEAENAKRNALRAERNALLKEIPVVPTPEYRLEVGAYFYVLQRLAHNGLYRLSSKGYNVPVCSYRHFFEPLHVGHWELIYRDWLPFILKTGVTGTLEVTLEKVHFRCQDYKDPLAHPPSLGNKSLVYVDPPYLTSDQSYTSVSWKLEDQQRLVSWVSSLPGKVIVSNSIDAVPLYESLPGQIHVVDRRNQVGIKSKKKSVEEMLYVSP